MERKPLFKERFTRTVAYELTPEEKELYDAVTRYLSKKKEEASETKNIHVSLALTVMQRRLVSSIFAIKNTFQKSGRHLQGIVDECKAKIQTYGHSAIRLEGFDVTTLKSMRSWKMMKEMH